MGSDAIPGHADELVALEDRSAVRVSAGAKREIQALGRLLLTEYAKLGTPPSEAGLLRLRSMLATRLTALKLGPIGPTFDSILSTALALGVNHALSEVDRPKRTVGKPKVDRATRTAVAGAGERARAALRDGRGALREARTLGDFTRALGTAHGAVSTLERTARWAVNRASAMGAAHVASELQAGLLWVAERDACVHCLAYSGRVAKSGEKFPGGLTFADKPLSKEPLRFPPLHPNCRCRVTPWSGSKSGVGDVEMPEALAREARRSILRGDARDSEPDRVRVEAARRLLARGSGLPRSVETKARRAVKAGSFR